MDIYEWFKTVKETIVDNWTLFHENAGLFITIIILSAIATYYLTVLHYNKFSHTDHTSMENMNVTLKKENDRLTKENTELKERIYQFEEKTIVDKYFESNRSNKELAEKIHNNLG